MNNTIKIILLAAAGVAISLILVGGGIPVGKIRQRSVPRSNVHGL